MQNNKLTFDGNAYRIELSSGVVYEGSTTNLIAHFSVDTITICDRATKLHIPIMSSRANILEINGEVKTFEQAQVSIEDALSSAGGASSADKVSYDNTNSGLTATNVQGAIDEVGANLGEYESKVDALIPVAELANVQAENVGYGGGVNLVDFDNVTAYKYLGTQGVPLNSQYEAWKVSDYIAVLGRNIATNASKVSVYIAVYDADKTFIRNITDTKNYTYQSGDVYIRVCFNGDKQACRANYGDTLLPYEDYIAPSNVRTKIEELDGNFSKIERANEILFGGVDMAVVFGFANRNGINVEDGKIINYDNWVSTEGSFMKTKYIPIAEGEYKLSYSSVGNSAILIYDGFNRVLKRWDCGTHKPQDWTNNGGTFTAPKGSAWIVISCYATATISMIPSSTYYRDARLLTASNGKKLVTIGDSITQYKSWQRFLSSFVGFEWSADETNIGVGEHYEDAQGNRYAESGSGRTLWKNAPMGLAGTGIRPVYTSENTPSSPTWTSGKQHCSIYERCKDAKFYNPDVILLWACANDFSAVQNAELCGTIDDAPYLGNEVQVDYMSQPKSGITIYSSVKGALEILSRDCPNARVIVLSLMPWYIYDDADYNTYMGYEKAVNKVLRECAEEYNIQYIDLFQVGINKKNASSYYDRAEGEQEGHEVGARQVHPNNNGSMRMAEYVSNILR